MGAGRQGCRHLFAVENPELQCWQIGKDESRRITAPVLSLVDERSHPAFVETEGLLREWFPQLETVRMPGVDHTLHLQRPAPVAAAVANFLARHPISVQQQTTST